MTYSSVESYLKCCRNREIKAAERLKKKTDKKKADEKAFLDEFYKYQDYSGMKQ